MKLRPKFFSCPDILFLYPEILNKTPEIFCPDFLSFCCPWICILRNCLFVLWCPWNCFLSWEIVFKSWDLNTYHFLLSLWSFRWLGQRVRSRETFARLLLQSETTFLGELGPSLVHKMEGRGTYMPHKNSITNYVRNPWFSRASKSKLKREPILRDNSGRKQF